MAGYPGLDLSAYPGDAMMQWLKDNTNLKWSGFYLGKAPSHPQTDWMSRRAALVAQGWGIAPTYVGQQVTGHGSYNTSLQQGYTDGADAAALMNSAGFARGSWVYLDLENGPPFTQIQHDYVGAWVDTVNTNGYNAGVYCSYLFAPDVHILRSSARVWVFRVSTTASHPVPGPNYPDNHPAGSGYAGAYAWQLGQSCVISAPGAPSGTLTVDLDTAVSPDPSAP